MNLAVLLSVGKEIMIQKSKKAFPIRLPFENDNLWLAIQYDKIIICAYVSFFALINLLFTKHL